MKKFYLKFSVDNRMFDTDQQFLLGEDIKRMAHVPLELTQTDYYDNREWSA